MFVTQTESALTLEQALNEANELQKNDVLGRMESLVLQVRPPPLCARLSATVRTAYLLLALTAPSLAHEPNPLAEMCFG